MQNRDHGAVPRGIQEFVRMPACRERAGFRFAIADHAGDDEIGIIESRAVGVQQRVSQFTAFIDGTRRLRRGVAGNAAGK